MYAKGADVDALRESAHRMTAFGNEVEEIRSTAKRAVHAMQRVWVGPDLEHVLERWRRVEHELHVITKQFDQTSHRLHHNVDSQRRSSGLPAGGHGGGGWHSGGHSGGHGGGHGGGSGGGHGGSHGGGLVQSHLAFLPGHMQHADLAGHADAHALAAQQLGHSGAHVLSDVAPAAQFVAPHHGVGDLVSGYTLIDHAPGWLSDIGWDGPRGEELGIPTCGVPLLVGHQLGLHPTSGLSWGESVGFAPVPRAAVLSDVGQWVGTSSWLQPLIHPIAR